MEKKLLSPVVSCWLLENEFTMDCGHWFEYIRKGIEFIWIELIRNVFVSVLFVCTWLLLPNINIDTLWTTK